MFSNADAGLANDVLGQINTIAALIFCAAIIAPRFNRKYFAPINLETNKTPLVNKNGTGRGLRLTPVGLTVIIVLVTHTPLKFNYILFHSYIACVWLVRNTIYRGITVSSPLFSTSPFSRKRHTALVNYENIS